MRQRFNDDFADLVNFITDYKLESQASEDGFQTSLRSIYKKYQAALVWHAYICNEKPDMLVLLKNGGDFRLYFEECVSDICQCIFLWCHGLYKPANLILRSGVENFFRCIGLFDDQKILEVKSVFELIDIVKETDSIRKSTSSIRHFQRLRNKYSHLCSHVHTADMGHMSLTTSVGVFPCYKVDQADDLKKEIQEILVSICSILCMFFPAHYRKFHHVDHDIISDIIPVAVKQEIMTELV